MGKEREAARQRARDRERERESEREREREREREDGANVVLSSARVLFKSYCLIWTLMLNTVFATCQSL